MKILHVISGLDTGGTELFLERLVTAPALRDFSPVVISLRHPGPVGSRLMRAGLSVHALNAGPGFSGIKAMLALRQLARREAPDLIQGWLYHGNLGASLARRVAGIRCPVLWNIRHSLDDWRNERFGLRATMHIGAKFSGSPARILYNSAAAARQHERLGYRSGKSVVIPNGVDCDQFHVDAELRSATRKRLGLDANVIVIGMLARYHPVKDHATFLGAARLLRARIPQSRFLLVGYGVDRENRGLFDRLKKAQLDTSVIALGERDDIPALLSALDVYVSSSRAEGFPNAVAEAMACGIPCVVTDVGSSRELVGETGIVVPPGSEQILAAAILQLVEQSAAQRCERGRAARERILSLYSSSRCWSAYAALYASFGNSAVSTVRQ